MVAGVAAVVVAWDVARTTRGFQRLEEAAVVAPGVALGRLVWGDVGDELESQRQKVLSTTSVVVS